MKLVFDGIVPKPRVLIGVLNFAFGFIDFWFFTKPNVFDHAYSISGSKARHSPNFED